MDPLPAYGNMLTFKRWTAIEAGDHAPVVVYRGPAKGLGEDFDKRGLSGPMMLLASIARRVAAGDEFRLEDKRFMESLERRIKNDGPICLYLYYSTARGDYYIGGHPKENLTKKDCKVN